MARRKIINIFLLISFILLILVAIKIDLFGRLIEYAEKYNFLKQNFEENQDDYPDYIYETFVDGDGKEISVKMEKKTGTIDGKEIIFYEDTLESEVINYHFYKGIVKSVDGEKVVFLVDKECLNANPEDSFYQYSDVEDYELVFYFKDYSSNQKDSIGVRDLIALNTSEINSFNDIKFLTGKYIRIQQMEFKDWLTKRNYKGLDFYSN